MSTGGEGHNRDEMEPDLEQARQTANLAHEVVIKLKEMGLPQTLDEELASLSTDLGDLWSAHQVLAERLKRFLETPHDWQASGECLVDLRANIDHIAWHLKSVRRPLNRIAQYAYRQALDCETPSEVA